MRSYELFAESYIYHYGRHAAGTDEVREDRQRKKRKNRRRTRWKIGGVSDSRLTCMETRHKETKVVYWKMNTFLSEVRSSCQFFQCGARSSVSGF